MIQLQPINRNSHNPAARLWTAANILTFLRIVLVVPAVLSVQSGRYSHAFMIMLLIGATDLMDGWVARRTGTASAFGAVFDVCADCIVVFSLQGFLLSVRLWPAHLIMLSAGAILSFFISLREPAGRRGSRPRIGKYTGAVLMIQLTALFLFTAAAPAFAVQFNRAAVIGTTVYLCLVIGENFRAAFGTAGIFRNWFCVQKQRLPR